MTIHAFSAALCAMLTATHMAAADAALDRGLAVQLASSAGHNHSHGHGHGHAQGHSSQSSEAAAAPVVAGALNIGPAWARASAGPARVGAAYLAIANGGDAADRLIDAASTAAERVEIHTHISEGGVMMMRRIEAIDLPSGATVELAPGGLHLMLMGLAAPLLEGGTFPLTLHFEKAGAVEVTVTVRAAGARDGGGGHKH